MMVYLVDNIPITGLAWPATRRKMPSLTNMLEEQGIEKKKRWGVE
jgi:hypothetical protein